MQLSLLVASLLLSFFQHVYAMGRRAPARLPLASTIVALKTVANSPHLTPPSSRHLARRRVLDAPLSKRQVAAQEKLLTVGGRIYMTEITLRGDPYTLVIDSGSSDTWVAASFFSCLNGSLGTPLATGACGFNSSYDPHTSPTWKPIPGHSFAVNYTGGEFLRGELGVEELGFGSVSERKRAGLTVNQTIGVVEEGYWRGDGVSSGLMGLAYPALVSGAGELGYQSVMFSLTANLRTRLFSLALSRPSPSNPTAGGLFAIGGVPPIPLSPFVSTPIVPVYQGLYAWYSLLVDGIAITWPSANDTSASSTSTSTSSTRTRTAPSSFPTPPSPNNNNNNNNNNPANASAIFIIDSGSSLMYLPDPTADLIASAFLPPGRIDPNSGLWTIRCDARAPRVGITIGGQTFWISEIDLMNRSKGAVGSGGRTGDCVLGVQRAGGGSLVLGDVWLKNVLVVFDLGAQEIRVAGREVY